MNEINTIENILQNIEHLQWHDALYFPKYDQSWKKDMPIMVLDPEDSEDPDDDPLVVKENGFVYMLTVSSAQDVMRNLLSQHESADIEVKLKALKYYFDRNAYISLL